MPNIEWTIHVVINTLFNEKELAIVVLLYRIELITVVLASCRVGLDNGCSYSVIFSGTGYSLSHSVISLDHGVLAGVCACVPPDHNQPLICGHVTLGTTHFTIDYG